MGRRARERVLDEHTYRHRARRLLELVGAGVDGRMSTELARRAPAAPDARLAGAAPDRDRAGLQRGAERRPRDRRAARVRSRARDRRHLRRLGRPDGRGRRRARRARDPAAVQPRDRRRGADRVPVRVGGAATSSSCASTATASTTRRSSAACSSRCSRARPTSSSARASSATRTTARRRRAASASACSRGSSRAIARQQVTDPTSGLPGAEPPRDPALRRRLPARLPRGRGDGDGDPAPAAPARGAGLDARPRARPLVDRRVRVGLLHGEGAARALRRPLPPGRDPARRTASTNDAAQGLDRRDDRLAAAARRRVRADPLAAPARAVRAALGRRPGSCSSSSPRGAAG